MDSREPRTAAMTTAGLQAKVRLRQAWFEAHPNQPIPEARDEVERLFVAIEDEAARAASEREEALREGLNTALNQWRAYADRTRGPFGPIEHGHDDEADLFASSRAALAPAPSPAREPLDVESSGA